MKRVQLSRKPGWRMPANTVKVARPSRWGNPFTIEMWGREQAITLFRHTMAGGWSPDWVQEMSDDDAALVYRLMHEFRARLGSIFPVDAARAELRGRNVACWCKADDSCHGDVLLEVANL